MKNTILDEICTKKCEHIAKCKEKISESSLLEDIKSCEPTRGFAKALQQKKESGKFGLIAEIKKASPSGGLIRDDFSPANLAKAYQEGGAACLSILTDEPYFQGKDEYLKEVRRATTLPLLRKDFMLDPYQVLEARAIGADCILIIMAAVDDILAQELAATAKTYELDALVEVHNEEELERALQLNTSMIGINNRNLKTLVTDLATTEELAPLIPDSYIVISESGIKQHSDLLRMQKSDISCFLVGEHLMRQENITTATKTLLGI